MKTFYTQFLKCLVCIVLLSTLSNKLYAQAGASLNFDRFNTVVQAANVPFGNNWTVEIWAYSTYTNTGWYALIGQNYWLQAPSGAGFVIATYNDTVFVNTPQGIYMTTSFSAFQWTHLALTYDNGTFAFYKNGILVGTQIAPFTNATTPLDIGCRTQNTGSSVYNWFEGYLDEARVWTVTRSQCDIQAYMNCEIPNNATGLYSNYHFNQGTGGGVNTGISTLTDATSGAHNATLSGFLLSGATRNWETPSPFTSGFSTPTASAPEINVVGNGVSIPDGTSVSSLTNNTDFGTSPTRVFTIQSTGVNTLNAGIPIFTGSNRTEFKINIVPTQILPALTGSTSFQAVFTPTSAGAKTATLNIYNSDCSEPWYDFVVTATAIAASALNFDGVNDYVQTTDPNFGTGDFTLEGWIKPTSSAGGFIATTRTNEGGPAGNWWTLGYGSGNIGLELSVAGVGYTNTGTSSGAATPGVWSHVAVVRSGTTIYLYINGNLSSTAVFAGIHNLNTGHNVLNFGGCPGQNSGWFNSSYDEIRMWTVARTQCEIQTFMNCEIATTPTTLVGNYHFNQGVDLGVNTAVTTLTDASASSRNGTLTNFGLVSLPTSNWVNPGGVTSGSTTANTPTVEIDVRGNGNSIIDGNTTTSAIDFTDFNGALTRTFTIHNTLAGVLGIAPPYITGANANQFSVTTIPASSISGIGSTTLVITFTPTSLGIKNATINIPNGDCNEPLYDFVITASATPASALDFDGSNDQVTGIPNLVLNNQSFTIEFWAKRNGNADYDIVFGQGPGGANSGLHIGFMPGNSFIFGFYGNDLTVTHSDFAWHHWACVYKAGAIGKNRFIYRDGILITHDISPSDYLGTGNVLLGHSTFSSGDDFLGTVDELRVWNVARTQCEIQTYMNCEIPSTASNLLANFHFNQGLPGGTNSGITTLLDAANSNNGTLTGFSLSGATSNWVTPGGIISNYTTAVQPTASLVLTGNAISIPVGVATTTNNFTDFGTNTSRTFFIQNPGASPLYINNGVFTGANASNFSVTTGPSTLIAGSGITSFVISFTPTAVGSQSAILNLISSDCANPNYSFAITASTSPASALDFDGTDNVSVPYNSSFSLTSAFSVEFWVKLNTIAGNQELLAKGTDDAVNGHFGFLFTNGYPKFTIFQGAFNNAFTTTNALSPGVWTHVAGTWNGTLMSLYINGLLVATQPLTGPISLNTGDLQIGWLGKLPSFPYLTNGKFDEVRIWNAARTQCEIQSYMNCEIPTTAANLVANYHFNQGLPSLSNSTVTTLIDAANGYNGTLNGFTLNGSTSNWVNPGGVISGSTTPSAPTASILVSGNSNPITSGSTSTSTLNLTNFGSTTTSTFVIKNNATGTLNIAAPYFTGVNASEFSVTVLPSLSLAASATTSFVVVFTPTAGGFRTATLNINNNDCNIPIFSCAIGGTPAPAAALNLDGNNDYITVTGHTLNAQPFTIEFYAKRNSNTTQDYVYSQGTTATSAGLHLGFYAAPLNFFNFGFWNNDLDVPHNDLLWHHWACVYDPAATGNNRFVYRDGILIGSNTNTIGVYTGTGLSTIGSTPWNTLGDAFDGSIDELRIWNVARSQCEIQTYMGCEIPTTATGLIANYHFNQGAAGLNNSGVTTLTDVSSTPHNGTLNNFGLNGTSSNWIAPGAIASGYTTTSAPTASITLTGNGNTILNNSTSPSTLNLTDFGSTSTSTFVIKNSALSGTLNIATPYITGANASAFSITVLPSSSLTTLATTTFVVVYTPTAGGTSTAIINIIDNDCNIPIFNFEIQGTPAPAAALNFDGSNDYIQTPPLTFTNTLTVEGWFKTGNSSRQELISLVGIMEVQLSHYYTGMFGYNLNLGGWQDVELNNPSFYIADNTWHHFAIVMNGNTANGYLDGKVHYTALGTAIGPVTTTLVIGMHNSLGIYFDGSVDDIRVWNTARSQCEIQSYMHCEIPTTAPGLVANYHFNQGAAGLSNPTQTVLVDAAGTNNGTLNTFNLTGTTSNWVSPGGVISGSTTPAPPTASILVSGNSTSITPGSTGTSTLNWTDFGSLTTRTFVIQNSATGTLNISAPYFTGVNASEFSVTVLPSLSLAASATTSFVVAFTPTTGGFRTATLNINNNDCNIPIFNCAIGGTPTPASALNLDGIDDYVSIAHTSSLNAFPLTVETWVKTSYTGSVPTALVGKYVTTSFNGWLIYLANGTLNAYYFNSVSNSINYPITAITNVTDNNWHHIALVVDATGGRLYVDGILSSPNEPWIGTPSPPSTTQNVLLGSYDTFFPGSLDEVRIWNTARSQCDIQSYMNCEIPANTAGLMANYHFNQGAAGLNNSGVTTLLDAAGANTGTLNTFSLSGTTSNWIAPGPFANGYTTTIVPTGTITITGNGNNVPQGTTTSTNNFTDFGSNISRAFVIQNPGSGPIYINNGTFSGANASNFSVTTLPSTVIAGSGTSNFVINFTPTAVGSQSAILTINSSDCANPNYSFVITASTSPASVLNFSGSGEFVGLPGSATVPTGNSPYTIEAWIKPNNFANYGIIGWGNYGTTNQVNAFRMGTGGALVNYWWGNDLGVSVPTLTNGAWHHVAATFDGITRSIYVDGILAGSDNPTGHSVPNNNNLKIGVTCTTSCSGGPEFFNGSMDELRVWNVGRSQCQIVQYMNCEIPSTASGLVVNYHFNQGLPSGPNATVTTLNDATGSYNGTLVNFGLSSNSSNWISPGPFANGYTTAIAPTGTITVTGNGNNIPMGSATSTNNFTDFGISPTRSFVITNPGSGTLFINSVNLSGVNASSFSVTTLPNTSLTALGTTSFVVAFTPTALGIQSTTLTINSSDCTSPNYSFVITATAVAGAALNFDGTDDYARAPVFNTLTNNLTLQARVNWNGIVATNKVIAYNGNSGPNGYGLFVAANSNSVMILYGGINTYYSGFTLTPNQWTSLSMVIETSKVSFYANGILTTTLNPGGNPAVPTGSFNIGTGIVIATEPFNGNIDEVLLWSKALAQCEIQAYLTCEVATSSPSLIANYHFNQGIGAGVNSTITTLTDASGNNNHLTLSNFSKTGTSSNFISTGAVTSGSSCGVFIASEIDVLSGTISIPDGYATPTTTNNTNFGAVCANTIIVKTYTIQNTGNGPLAISNMSMSGINATSFSIGVLTPASPIPSNTFAVFSVTFAPGVAGIKTATVNISNNDCDEGLYDFVITGTANVIPTVTASISNSVVCAGTSVTLTGSGADTYTWSPLVPNAVGFVPTINQLYTLSGTYTLTGCTNTNLATKAVTVNALPVMTITAVNPVICSGNIATLTASGSGTGGTYTWNPNALNGATINPTPSLTTTYSVVGTSSASCTSTNVVTQLITVNTTPTLSATSVNTVICAGFTATLSVNGANTYSWFPGPLTGGTITPSPGSTTSYTVTGYGSTGCISSNSITLTVTVNALPTVSASTSQSLICNTGTTSLNGSGASTYTWNGGIPTITNGVVFSPSTTLSYTLSGSNALTGCTSTNLAVQTISVNPTPSITASAPSSVICNGSTATLIAGGAASYTWMPGTIIGATVNPATATLTTYTVVGTSSLGCTSTNVAIQTISVNSLPTVTASISSSVICLGGTVMVNGLGADTYTWTNSVSDNIAFTPAASGIYSVSGTSTLTGCTSTNVTSVSLIVNALPTLTITNSNPVICFGGSVSLSGSGASSYTWSNGISDNTAFSPSLTSDYTLTASDANTCTNTAVTSITVNNLPVLSVTSSPSISCEAQTTTLTVNGAATYTWNTHENTPSIVIAPTVTTVYTVTAIDVNTCTNTISYTQSVSPCPGVFTATVVKTDISCIGKDDGKIVITPVTSYSNPVISYIWNPSSLCPGNNCDTLKHLPSGTYNLKLKITYTVNGTLVKTDSLVLTPITLVDLSGACEVKIFNGITANSDGANDVLTIENIEQFPDNKVEVFNRWGQKVFEMKGYNNLDKAWPLKDDLGKLSPNTYFYIIDLGSGSKPIKGWIELMKN